MREKKSNVVIFRTLFSYLSLNQSLESIFSIILNSFWRMLPHIFYQPYNSRSLAMQGFARCYYLISKRNQRTYNLGHLVRSVSCRANNKSFLEHSICLFRFKSFKLKQCENKLSSNNRHPSLS